LAQTTGSMEEDVCFTSEMSVNVWVGLCCALL